MSRIIILKEIRIGSRQDLCFRGSLQYECLIVNITEVFDYINPDGSAGTASRLVSTIETTGNYNYLQKIYNDVGYYHYAKVIAALEEHFVSKSSGMPPNSGYRKLFEEAYARVLNKLDFIVEKGQLTFDSEGQEDGPYHSRVPHMPSDVSGVTIGRGYDMKERKKDEVFNDLTAAGLTGQVAVAYSKGAGLQGQEARNFIRSANLPEITAKQQKKLFIATYSQQESEVRRICQKLDTVKDYGSVDWDKLDFRIKEVLTDLKFRGDYTSGSRKIIQKHVSNNNLQAFKDAISNKLNWKNVPRNRFECRIAYLNNRPFDCK